MYSSHIHKQDDIGMFVHNFKELLAYQLKSMSMTS